MYEKINNTEKYSPHTDDSSMKNELKNYLKDLKKSNSDNSIPTFENPTSDSNFSTY